MICLQEKVLITSMLHSYRQAKGDINENGTNTGVKYECLKVKRKMFGFICSFIWGEEIRFCLTVDVHLFM